MKTKSHIGSLLIVVLFLFSVDAIAQNLASGKPTEQSSGFNGDRFPANLAVDGNKTNFTHTATGSANYPSWWVVDLGDVYDIEQINVFNRTSSCCRTRIVGAQLQIATDPNNYEVVSTLNANLEQQFNNINQTARYVRVYLTTSVLSLAEVEVFGTLHVPPTDDNGGGDDTGGDDTGGGTDDGGGADDGGSTGNGPSVWTQSGTNINYNDGNVGIGTTTPDEKLAVNGTIHAREVRVDLSGWPDYVFDKNYNLPSLEEIQKHIKEKGHLPNIPSAKEVAENGVELGEMNKLLLEKIEELTLYILEMEKKHIYKDAKIMELETRLNKIEKLLKN